MAPNPKRTKNNKNENEERDSFFEISPFAPAFSSR
jgi:hypothetical protein